MSLLAGLNVVQIGAGLAAAVCGRLFADVGATVRCLGAGRGDALGAWLNHAKPDAGPETLAQADLIIAEGRPAALRQAGHDAAALRRHNPTAAIVLISPFGQTGPDAEHPASDLTLFYASGIARLLTGQVDDLDEAPLRAVGEQSAFIGGVAAACAGMHAVLAPEPATVDVSLHEALATLAMTELANAGLTGRSRSRKRISDGNGATVCILPASDGYVAISPREDRQWAWWLEAMGSPAWGDEPRFRTKPDRVANWDALHALMSGWGRQHTKQWIADTAQAAHVPSFPLREPAEQLTSPQLVQRGFWRTLTIGDRPVQTPGSPFGLTLASAGRSWQPTGTMPLSGLRVLDFSWVIAGPTTTRYLAAMGAEVIKVEAPGRGDPGRTSELHTVLGQAKQGIVLDLKQSAAVEVARGLAAQCDVLVENFATGVMDRLGLGAAALQAMNPALLYLSASGMGRTGPEAQAVAYGTLLQCYTGFAGLNRHPDRPPRVGFAWLDPMCGLMLAFVTAAGLWQRRRGGQVPRVDFSMIEAMLWTMAEPLLQTQVGDPPQPAGNASRRHAPHGAFRCAGDDDWVSLAVTDQAQWQALCRLVPLLETMTDLTLAERQRASAAIDAVLAEWCSPLPPAEAAGRLVAAGVPAAALADSVDLVASPHLSARGFWERVPGGVLPGLPWQASFGRVTGPAPGLGADTDRVLAEVLGLSGDRIATLRASGALG